MTDSARSRRPRSRRSSDARLLKREHRRQRTGLSLKDFARNYADLVGDIDPQDGRPVAPELANAAARWWARKGGR